MKKANRRDELEKLLAAFPLSMLQDFITFTMHCKREKIEDHEIVNFIKEQVAIGNEISSRVFKREIEVKKLMAEKFPYCAVCGQQLGIQEVNNHPSRMIDDHSKSWWICPDAECEADPILNDKYPYEIFIDLGIPVNQPLKPQSSRRRSLAAAAKKRRG